MALGVALLAARPETALRVWARHGRWARAVLVLAIVVGGLAGTYALASITDDAFISFRYVRNLLDGNGLVYNLDERVEGDTNLLWVLLVALGQRLTGAEIPLVAIVENFVLVAANLLACARLGQATARREGVTGAVLPIGAALLSANAVFRGYSTTGLETGLATLLLQLGAGAVAAGSPAWAGLALALATITRPDQGLFFAIGAFVFVSSPRALGRYLAGSLPLLVATSAWRVWFYGDWVPNTAFAKSADLPYWSQGVVYTAEFWLGAYGWTLLVGALVWLALARGQERYRVFLTLSVAGQLLYVTRLGGDFMAGRFFVCLLPLLAVASERALDALAARGRIVSLALLSGVLVFGVNAWSLVPPKKTAWYLADEGSFYRVRSWSPIRIDHKIWAVGDEVGRTLTDRGIRFPMSSGTIGMLGYYGRQELIDHHGLTDRTVAHMPIRKRSRPGHEKFASREYLRSRDIRIAQSNKLCAAGPHPDVQRITFRGKEVPSLPMCFLRWDADLAHAMRSRAPEWHFVDLPTWLDTYLAGAPTLDAATLTADRIWLDDYYFRKNPDPPRRARLDAAWSAAVARSPEEARAAKLAADRAAADQPGDEDGAHAAAGGTDGDGPADGDGTAGDPAP